MVSLLFCLLTRSSNDLRKSSSNLEKSVPPASSSPSAHLFWIPSASSQQSSLASKGDPVPLAQLFLPHLSPGLPGAQQVKARHLIKTMFKKAKWPNFWLFPKGSKLHSKALEKKAIFVEKSGIEKKKSIWHPSLSHLSPPTQSSSRSQSPSPGMHGVDLVQQLSPPMHGLPK